MVLQKLTQVQSLLLMDATDAECHHTETPVAKNQRYGDSWQWHGDLHIQTF
jgi:hypothetical protein